MKLYTPDKTVLMDVTAIRPHPDGLVIEGKIMGAMPMKAILRPAEARAAFKLLSWPVFKTALSMLLRGR
ncbi:MAG TPA: hypothetical protein VF509_16615 [Sphingobium sp.]